MCPESRQERGRVSRWAGVGDGRRDSSGGSQETHGDADDNSLLPWCADWRFTRCLPSTCEAGGEEGHYLPLHSKTNMLKSMAPSETRQSFPGVLKIPSPMAYITAPAWHGGCPPPAGPAGPKLCLSVTPGAAVFWSLLM